MSRMHIFLVKRLKISLEMRVWPTILMKIEKLIFDRLRRRKDIFRFCKVLARRKNDFLSEKNDKLYFFYDFGL
jgi:hypothetical protein